MRGTGAAAAPDQGVFVGGQAICAEDTGYGIIEIEKAALVHKKCSFLAGNGASEGNGRADPVPKFRHQANCSRNYCAETACKLSRQR